MSSDSCQHGVRNRLNKTKQSSNSKRSPGVENSDRRRHFRFRFSHLGHSHRWLCKSPSRCWKRSRCRPLSPLHMVSQKHPFRVRIVHSATISVSGTAEMVLLSPWAAPPPGRVSTNKTERCWVQFCSHVCLPCSRSRCERNPTKCI